MANKGHLEMIYFKISKFSPAEIPKTITKLEINACRIDDSLAIELAAALRFRKSLTHLSITYSNLTDQGLISIIDAIKENDNLTVLDLTGNLITEQGMKYLYQSLPIPDLKLLSSHISRMDLLGNSIFAQATGKPQSGETPERRSSNPVGQASSS